MGLQGEGSKDDKYATKVGLVGGIFVPLVAEMLGLWTLFALQCLSQIASTITLHSGLPPSEATRHGHAQTNCAHAYW